MLRIASGLVKRCWKVTGYPVGSRGCRISRVEPGFTLTRLDPREVTGPAKSPYDTLQHAADTLNLAQSAARMTAYRAHATVEVNRILLWDSSLELSSA